MNAGETDGGEAGSGGTGAAGGGVLVVGAGPVGLVAAVDLARRGVAVRVVDAASGPAAGSRGKGLQPRSLEVLDDLGVAGRIIATGRCRLAIRRYRGDTVLGTSEVTPDVPESTPSTPYPRTLIVPQWRVEEVLRERLAELGVSVEFGAELTGLRQGEDGAHALVRTAGRTEEAAYAYVIGCDGASGTVRNLSGIGFLGKTDETVRMLTADVELSGLDRDFWHWWPGTDGRLLALCPLPATDAFQLQIGVSPETEGELPLARVQELVEERTGRTGIRVRRTVWQSVWRYNVRMVDRYRDRRVFLAGDSAHVHSPAGGQGMNTGIQDAYNLAWKIGNVLGGAPGELLDTYEQERMPVAAAVLDLSDELIAARVRGIVPGERRGADTLQLSVHYPAGALNGSDRDGRAPVQAGDRAPDAPLRAPGGNAVRLFDLLRGPHTTAVAFGPRSTAVAAAAAARLPGHVRSYVVSLADSGEAGDTAHTDGEGHAHRGYGVDGDTLVVVRPDGYVGLRATDPDEEQVLAYLDRLVPRGATH